MKISDVNNEKADLKSIQCKLFISVVVSREMKIKLFCVKLSCLSCLCQINAVEFKLQYFCEITLLPAHIDFTV